MNLLLIFGLVIIFSCARKTNGAKLKYCIVKIRENNKLIRDICQLLEMPKQNAECITAIDRLTCMRLVTSGIADFTILEPEDLIVAIENYEYHIVLTHEIRLWKNETSRVEMVVIVHKDVYDLSDMKRKRLCYPELETSNNHNRDYTSYFERELIPQECDPHKTLLENRISTLSHYFQAACIAGAWSSNTLFDNELKSKYVNLCAICDNPLGCYSSDKYYGREGALVCLTENAGDIAWTTLSSARLHFQAEGLDKDKFNYLCPDGTVRSMTFEPCTWIAEPWPVVAARADVAERVSQFITEQIDKNGNFLRLLKTTNTYIPPIQFEKLETAESYLQKFPGYLNAESPSTCYPSRDVQWCVASSVEYQKCQWLNSASNAYGIKPATFCTQESNRMSCLDAVREKRADLFVARPEEELEARKKGLKPILYLLPNNREDMNKIGILVLKRSNYTSLADLKGTKACLGSYGSIGWNAVVAVISNLTEKEFPCSDKEVVSQYFGDSCVSGLSAKNETIPKNLYSLCSQISPSHLFGRYNNDEDVLALKCLVTSGDVAFVNITRAKEIIQKEGGGFYQRFKSICVDESDSDRNCFLTWTTLGMIMIHENETTVREEEIRSMLVDMDQFFGQTFLGRTPLFSLYGTFDNKKNVIFSENTRYMHRETSHVRHGRSYTDILNELAKRQTLCNGSRIPGIKGAKLFVVLLFLPILSML